VTEWGEHKLWPAQITAISFIYRLIKYAGARRVLFLVDRGNPGRQTKKVSGQYVLPVTNYKFGEEPFGFSGRSLKRIQAVRKLR
jgi:hypothetical protein